MKKKKKRKEEDSWKSMKNNGDVDGGDEEFDGGYDDGVREVADFETEMWDRFDGAGFWRAPSQREDSNGIK